MRAQNTILNFVKGIIIGFGTLIPGLSGGTMAMILGVFESILDAACNFFTNPKKSLGLLFPIATGVIVGVVVFSYPLNLFCVNFPMISKAIFAVISVVSVMLFVKFNFTAKFKMKYLAFTLTGAVISCLFSIITSIYQLDFSNSNVILNFIIGMILSIALVLPAISFSYVMLYFGIYEITLHSIYNFKISFLFPLSLGVMIGCYVFSRILYKLIEKHKHETYAMILGFVLASLADIVK